MVGINYYHLLTINRYEMPTKLDITKERKENEVFKLLSTGFEACEVSCALSELAQMRMSKQVAKICDFTKT